MWPTFLAEGFKCYCVYQFLYPVQSKRDAQSANCSFESLSLVENGGSKRSIQLDRFIRQTVFCFRIILTFSLLVFCMFSP